MDQLQAHRQWVQSAVVRYQRPLLRYAASLLGGYDRAADAVQETFCRLCGQNQKDIDDHLAPWLFAVCRHYAIDAQRRSSRPESNPIDLRQARPASKPMTPAAADPLAEAEWRELEQRIAAALMKLPARQRELIELKYRGGLTYRQIAAITGLTITNVGYLLHVAIDALRDGLF